MAVSEALQCGDIVVHVLGYLDSGTDMASFVGTCKGAADAFEWHCREYDPLLLAQVWLASCEDHALDHVAQRCLRANLGECVELTRMRTRAPATHAGMVCATRCARWSVDELVRSALHRGSGDSLRYIFRRFCIPEGMYRDVFARIYFDKMANKLERMVFMDRGAFEFIDQYAPLPPRALMYEYADWLAKLANRALRCGANDTFEWVRGKIDGVASKNDIWKRVFRKAAARGDVAAIRVAAWIDCFTDADYDTKRGVAECIMKSGCVPLIAWYADYCTEAVLRHAYFVMRVALLEMGHGNMIRWARDHAVSSELVCPDKYFARCCTLNMVADRAIEMIDCVYNETDRWNFMLDLYRKHPDVLPADVYARIQNRLGIIPKGTPAKFTSNYTLERTERFGTLFKTSIFGPKVPTHFNAVDAIDAPGDLAEYCLVRDARTVVGLLDDLCARGAVTQVAEPNVWRRLFAKAWDSSVETAARIYRKAKPDMSVSDHAKFVTMVYECHNMPLLRWATMAFEDMGDILWTLLDKCWPGPNSVLQDTVILANRFVQMAGGAVCNRDCPRWAAWRSHALAGARSDLSQPAVFICHCLLPAGCAACMTPDEREMREWVSGHEHASPRGDTRKRMAACPSALYGSTIRSVAAHSTAETTEVQLAVYALAAESSQLGARLYPLNEAAVDLLLTDDSRALQIAVEHGNCYAVSQILTYYEDSMLQQPDMLVAMAHRALCMDRISVLMQMKRNDLFARAAARDATVAQWIRSCGLA